MKTRKCQFKSKVQDIALLHLYPFPAKPAKMDRVVRSGKHDTIVGISANGRIYSTQVLHSPVYWATTKRFAATVESLIKLGILSREAIDQHNAAQEKEAEAEQRARAAVDFREASSVLGIQLTKAQERATKLAARD